MKKAIIVAVGLCLILSACNTFEGMGQDIQKGGEVITNSASKTKDKM